jgi:hypothetical protein
VNVKNSNENYMQNYKLSITVLLLSIFTTTTLDIVSKSLQGSNDNKLKHIIIMLTITYTKVLTMWYTDQKYFWKLNWELSLPCIMPKSQTLIVELKLKE